MNRERRWWWRVLISVAGGVALLLSWGYVAAVAIGSRRLPSWLVISNMVCAVAISEVVSLVIYHKLTYQGFPCRGETYCRQCGYILRGLTEPRCPECGEHL